jgi:hypothetical protein
MRGTGWAMPPHGSGSAAGAAGPRPALVHPPRLPGCARACGSSPLTHRPTHPPTHPFQEQRGDGGPGQTVHQARGRGRGRRRARRQRRRRRRSGGPQMTRWPACLPAGTPLAAPSAAAEEPTGRGRGAEVQSCGRAPRPRPLPRAPPPGPLAAAQARCKPAQLLCCSWRVPGGRRGPQWRRRGGAGRPANANERGRVAGSWGRGS